MRHFLSVHDVPDLTGIINLALELKANPWKTEQLGRHKTLGLVFLNASLRTRLSTQLAARRLGLDVVVMNLHQEGWALELKDGVVMNGSTQEHIREAAAVLGSYCDVLGVRCFPGLADRAADYAEEVLNRFVDLTHRPILSLESATRHPLQSLADMVTIRERGLRQPKVVLTWAPHIKPIPQAVANSFAEWALVAGHDLTIVYPEGYELAGNFTSGAKLTHNQEEALAGADFVYVKNWSSYTHYGQVLTDGLGWMLTPERLGPQTLVMHCLPVRRDLELSASILDGPQSLVQAQAANRIVAAQAVLHEILQTL